MLKLLHPKFRVLQNQPKASTEELERLIGYFPLVPSDYIQLANEATEVELEWNGEQYLRIWNPSGCIEMDQAYGFQRRIEGSVPIGDDGGGGALVYMNGDNGWGVYRVGFGDIDRHDALWIATSLKDLLIRGEGIEILLDW